VTSFLGRYNLFSCQVAPAGHTVILTCRPYSFRDEVNPSTLRVAPADPRDGS